MKSIKRARDLNVTDRVLRHRHRLRGPGGPVHPHHPLPEELPQLEQDLVVHQAEQDGHHEALEEKINVT